MLHWLRTRLKNTPSLPQYKFSCRQWTSHIHPIGNSTRQMSREIHFGQNISSLTDPYHITGPIEILIKVYYREAHSQYINSSEDAMWSCTSTQGPTRTSRVTVAIDTLWRIFSRCQRHPQFVSIRADKFTSKHLDRVRSYSPRKFCSYHVSSLLALPTCIKFLDLSSLLLLLPDSKPSIQP